MLVGLASTWISRTSVSISALPKEFLRCINYIHDYDLVIGSRLIRDDLGKIQRPFSRTLFSHLYSFLFRILFNIPIKDTQCGFKCFRAQAALDLFSTQRLDGMSFDVEVLYIARKRGYRIVEVPVDWYFHRETRVRMLRDSFGMFFDILALRRNWRDGKYAGPR